MSHDWDNHEQIWIAKRGAWPCIGLYFIRMYNNTISKWSCPIGACQNAHDNLAEWIYFAHDFNKQTNQYLQKFIKNKELIQKLEQFVDKTFLTAAKKLTAKDVKKLSDKELMSFIDIFFEAFDQSVSAAMRLVDSALSRRIEQIVIKKLGAIPTGAMSTLALCERESFNTQEEKALLVLAKKLVKQGVGIDSAEAQQGIKEIHDNFCWITCGYYTENARTVEEYARLLKDRMPEPADKLEALEKKEKQEIAKRNELIAQLQPNEEEAFIIRLAQLSTFVKDINKFRLNEIIYGAEPFFEEAAHRLKMTPARFKCYFHSEMPAALLERKFIDDAKLAERIRHYVVVAEPGIKMEVYEGKDADAFEKKYIETTLTGETEFKGRIVCKGLSKGTVKIVLGAFDFAKVQEGDILIVSNTTPDYVRIMKKAAAIVAEEGGLTAHVSIISREFGIPCIVGVKHITSILKDGDIVEVDANTGIVRRLKS